MANDTNSNQERTGAHIAAEVKRTKVPYGTVAVWFLGQESVILKGGETVVYIDPYVSEDGARQFPPVVGTGDVLHADAIFITHDHSDHLDKEAMPVIAASNPDAVFMAPFCCGEQLKERGVQEGRLLGAKEGERVTFGPELEVVPVAAAHESLERDEEGHPRYVGYIMRLNGVSLYHAGDTVLFPELIETVKEAGIDLALVPINGRDYFRNSRNIVGNMNYREAAEFAAVAGFDTVIPLHYDLFAGNAEHPGYFVDYLYNHFPHQKSHVMARGERFVYVSPRSFLD